MKLLINICAHDGIISHYSGVGTMVDRYILESINFCTKNNYDYEINLFTPQYNTKSFGFSADFSRQRECSCNINVVQVSNGSNAKVNFGTIDNWKVLCVNTSEIINMLKYDEFDKVITICNDTPYAGLIELLNCNSNHIKVWIPHSTIKIHKVDSAIQNSENFYQQRLDWEQNCINYINSHQNTFVGCVSGYLRKHLICEYSLIDSKAINIINGEDLSQTPKETFSKLCIDLFAPLQKYDCLIMSFGRAEEYKNLEAAFYLGKELNIMSIVLAQSYYKGQPIMEYYKDISKTLGEIFFDDPPFDFAKYIISNYKGVLIVLVPSKAEIFGLIINEVRKYNKDNVLIVANNVGGLVEQIQDGVDGVLVDLNDIKSSSQKILKYLNTNKITAINKQSQVTLKNRYDFKKIFDSFMNIVLGGTKNE